MKPEKKIPVWETPLLCVTMNYHTLRKREGGEKKKIKKELQTLLKGKGFEVKAIQKLRASKKVGSCLGSTGSPLGPRAYWETVLRQ